MPELEKIIKETGFDFKISQLRERLNSVNDDIKNKGIVYYKKTDSELLTGYDYNQFYDWDLYFENIYQLYNGESKFCFSNLDVFFSIQKRSGFIKRSFGTRNYGWRHPFKPFIAQIVLLGCNAKDDYSYAKEHFEQIEKYLNYYYRKYDSDNNLLCCWVNADASGMDNQNSRVLLNRHGEGVDLNCYLYREYKALAVLYKKVGRMQDFERCNEKSIQIKNAINEFLWDEDSGFYYDRNDKNGKLNMVKGISGFVPLWCGVASEEQAKRLVCEHLTNSNEFMTEYPIATLSKDSKAYLQTGYNPPSGLCNWNGPLWVPMNYMIFHGLMDYGYTEIAKDIALKTFEAVFFKNSVTREYYNAVTGEGYGRNPFYGWSVLAYFMPLEYLLNYNPTRINDDAIKPLAKFF